MTKPPSHRLGLCLLASLFAAACAGSPLRKNDARQDYIAARARYGRTMDSLYTVSSSAATAADRAAVADLATRLRAIVAPLDMSSVTDTGVVDLGTFLSGNINVDLPDGISYRGASDLRVFVTDSTLFHAWIAQRFHTEVPVDLAKAAGHPLVTTWAFADYEAAVVNYADLPVTSAVKRVLFAQLINRAQDDCYDCGPHWVLVGVSVDTRIMIAELPVTDAMPVTAECAKLVGESLVQLRACYAKALVTDKRYPRLVAKAQALVDALPRER